MKSPWAALVVCGRFVVRSASEQTMIIDLCSAVAMLNNHYRRRHSTSASATSKAVRPNSPTTPLYLRTLTWRYTNAVIQGRPSPNSHGATLPPLSLSSPPLSCHPLPSIAFRPLLSKTVNRPPQIYNNLLKSPPFGFFVSPVLYHA